MAQGDIVATNKGVLEAAVANAGTVVLPFRGESRAKWAVTDLTTLRVVVGELGSYGYPSVSVTLGTSMTITNNTGVPWPKDTHLRMSATQPVISIVRMTQTEYDLVPTPDTNSLYVSKQGVLVPNTDAAALRLAANSAGNIGKPHIFNANGAFRRKHQMKLAKAYAGGGRYKISCIGDSQTVGAGAGTDADFLTGAKVKAYPANLAKLLRNAGFIVSEDSIMGDNRLFTAGVAAVTLYDPKAVFAGTGWSRSSGVGSLGGRCFINSTNGDIFSFTPAVAGQNIDVYYSITGGGGTFRISDAVAGALGADVATAGGSGFQKVNRTRTLAANAIQIARQSGGNTYIAAIDQWANDTQISIYNCGAYGVSSSDWSDAAQPYSARNAQLVLAPDLIVIHLGANNVRDGVVNYGSHAAAAIAFKTNIQDCITAWTAASIDIVLVVPFPSDATDASWAPYIQALYELAFANNIPLVNLYDRFVSRTVSLAEYQDSVHLKAEGYADVAMAVWELLRPQ